MPQREITFISGGELLTGEVWLPVGSSPHPAVLLIGGTMSDTRDGDPVASLYGKAPRHGMFRVTAERLAQAGLASLRWDKRGVGASTGPPRDTHSDVWTDVEDAEQALLTLSQVPEVDATRIAVLGESAGGYFLCFLAQRTNLPAAYVLQAALYTSIPDMIEFNYQRVVDYAARGPAEAKWIEAVAPRVYRAGQHWRAYIAAAAQGVDVYEVETPDGPFRAELRRLKQELAYPPAEQFRYIQKPTLVIQGHQDLNVPPSDCYQIVAALRAAGNQAVTLEVIPGADHSMQQAAPDEETRMRERISMESFKRPYVEAFFTALTGWLTKQLSGI